LRRSSQTRAPSCSAITPACRACRPSQRASTTPWPAPTGACAQIAAIIKCDLGTTTYLLQVANSPLYAGAGPPRQVEQAIARLGINSTRHLVMAHAVRSTVVTRSGLLTSLMQRTWASSTRLAALCGVLAKHCSSFRPGERDAGRAAARHRRATDFERAQPLTRAAIERSARLERNRQIVHPRSARSC
jgi:hypothetical protein